MVKTTRRASPSKEKTLQPKEAANLEVSKAVKASPWRASVQFNL